MADPNLGAWLGFFGTVIVGLLGLMGILLQRALRDTRATREQVENNHTTNLREENDERHIEIMAELRAHGAILSRHGDLLVVHSKAIERLTPS